MVSKAKKLDYRLHRRAPGFAVDSPIKVAWLDAWNESNPGIKVCQGLEKGLGSTIRPPPRVGILLAEAAAAPLTQSE